MAQHSNDASKLAVLLAEDNPHVRALLQNALQSFAEVVSVDDGADALLRAAEQRPDMVIADFTLPGLDGLRLLEKLRGRPSTKDVAFVLMAPRSDVEQMPRNARELADEIVEKPFLLNDAITAIRRVIAKIDLQRALRSSASAATESAASGHMRGTLSQLSLVDLLQALELGGKTCRVTLNNQQQRCEVFVEKGAVVHAECGKQHGDEAVFAALAWSEGDFEIDFTAKFKGKKNVERTTQSLLMDGLRILDESRRDSDVLGDL
jgi:CheY-like chemotaxis protein